MLDIIHGSHKNVSSNEVVAIKSKRKYAAETFSVSLQIRIHLCHYYTESNLVFGQLSLYIVCAQEFDDERRHF